VSGRVVAHRAALQQEFVAAGRAPGDRRGAKDGNDLYARVAGSDTVVTIPSLEADHLSGLIALSGNTT
jgi:hypothetical protein